MGAKYSIDGDAAGAVKAVGDLQKAIEKADAAAVKSAKGFKVTEESAKRLAAQADPQERYNQKMAKLAEAVRFGGLEIGKAEILAKRYGVALQTAGNAGDKAFGARMFQGIMAAAGGVASVTGAVGLLKDALGDVEKRAQAAADRVFNAIGAFGELAQLDDKSGALAVSTARDLVRVGAVKPDNLAQGVGIASNFINAGFSAADLQFLVNDVAGSKLVAAENLDQIGGNLQKIRRSFNQSDLRNVTARVLQAAGETQADLSVTSREVLKYSPLAAASGVSLDESLAAFVVAEQRSASPEAAAENLKSFFSQVYRRGLASGDLQGTLANIQGKIGKGNAFDALGDANAVIGYQLLQNNIAAVTAQEAAIGRAQFAPSGVLQSDPILRAAAVRSRSEGALAAKDERLGEAENLLAALQAELDAKSGPTTRWFRKMDFAAADFFDEEHIALKAEVQRSELLGQRVSDELFSAMVDYLKRIADNTSRTGSRSRTREE